MTRDEARQLADALTIRTPGQDHASMLEELNRRAIMVRTALGWIADGGDSAAHLKALAADLRDTIGADPARSEAVRTCGGCHGRGTGSVCCVCGAQIPPSLRRTPDSPSELGGRGMLAPDAVTTYAAMLDATATQDEDDEPEPEDYDPGPECDGEGGMSEYRYSLPGEGSW